MIRSNYLSTAVLAALLGTAPAWAQSTDNSTQATSPAASAQATAKPLCSELNHPNAGIGRDALAANLVHSVITNDAGTRAYLSYWDLGTVILDISNPSAPRYLGRTGFEGDEDGNAHSIIGRVAQALRRQVSPEAATEFTTAAHNCGSYDELLVLAMETVTVH